MPITDALLPQYPPRQAVATVNGRLKRKHVFVVEDQSATREAIVETLNREEDLAVCGEADDVGPALTAIGESRPDLVLVDIQLKSSSGMELIREVRRQHSGTVVVAMTMFDPVRYEREARAAGAAGFVVKQEGAEKLVAAIRGALK